MLFLPKPKSRPEPRLSPSLSNALAVLDTLCIAPGKGKGTCESHLLDNLLFLNKECPDDPLLHDTVC